MLHMLLLVFTSVFIGPAHASPENPFRVTAQPLNVAAGAEATAQVTFHVPPGTYLYKEMTSVVVANPVGDDPDKELSRWVVESFGQKESTE